MGEWEKCTLGNAPFEIIDGDRGKNYPKQEDFFAIEHCLFLNAKNITTSGFAFDELNFITKERDQLLKKGKLLRNDSVLTTRGTVGHIGFYNESVPFDEIRINSGMVIIRPNGIDERFNYYLFKYLNKDFDVFVSGSAQPQLPIRDLKQIEFLLPPLPEQKAIASVLSSLDDKIGLLHRQNKTLEAMAQTLFRQWFVEEAQDDWEEGVIKDLIEVVSGFAFESSSFVESGKYQLITIKGVQDGFLDITNAAKINDISSRMPNYCFLQKRDILLSLTGNVGRCCLVDRNNLLLNQRVAKLQPKNNRDWAFTYIFFRQNGMKKALDDLAKGTAQANLSPIEMANMQIQISPEYLLENFFKEVTPSLEKIMSNKIQIRTLEKLRDILLSKLMSGKVRVEY